MSYSPSVFDLDVLCDDSLGAKRSRLESQLCYLLICDLG